MFQKIKLILIVFLLAHVSIGQDLQSDFKEIMDKMEAATSVAIDVKAEVFSTLGGTRLSSHNASLRISGTKTKSVLGEMENIDTPEFLLKVDHEEKALLILKKAKAVNGKKQKFKETIDLEALQDFFEESESKSEVKVTLSSNISGIKKYTITGIPGMQTMVIILDTNLKSIREITYNYGSVETAGQYIKLDYSFKYDSDLSKDFDLSMYFTVENTSFKAAKQLMGYTIYTEE